MRYGVIALAVLAVLNGCASDKGYKTKDVEQADYGDRWPFAPDSGVLACEPGNVPTFTSSGGTTIGLTRIELDDGSWSRSAAQAKAEAMRDEALDLCD